MPMRLAIAYGLIALIVITAIVATLLYRRKRRQERGMRRGTNWFDL